MTERLTAEKVEHVVRSLPALFSGLWLADNTTAPMGAELEDLLCDYFRVMEIAHFIRRGGVRAMIYRLETGKTSFVPVDYFDEAHQQLAERYQNLLKPESKLSEQSLLEELHAIAPEEETLVQSVLPQLDELLLLPKRQQALQLDEPAN